MKNKNPEPMKETKKSKEFVEELINENIKLMEENIKILLENRWLAQKIEELSRLNRELTGYRETGEYKVVCKRKST